MRKLVSEFPGFDSVIRNIEKEIGFLKLENPVRMDFLYVIGSKDLTLQAEPCPGERRYETFLALPQGWPHIIISAQEGKLQGIEFEFDHGGIIRTTSLSALVRYFPTREEHGTKIDSQSNGQGSWEAFLEFQYSNQ